MIKNLFNDDEPGSEETKETKAEHRTSSNQVLSLFDDEPRDAVEKNFVISEAEPASVAETVRQNGLAYSAGVAFVAAVVFMLILGWGADILFGSSPWGVVGGIILGSVIGFIQLFRISSQIFKK